MSEFEDIGKLEIQEGMAFGRDLVIRGADERLAPILLTRLATGLALVPIVTHQHPHVTRVCA